METKTYNVEYIADHIVDNVDYDDKDMLELMVTQDAERMITPGVTAVAFNIDMKRKADSYYDVAGTLTLQGTTQGIQNFLNKTCRKYA